jgi:cellulose synthase/poly-beta-1,6-N-acetylglucosamine synthase-like glycosyltransferase
VEAFNFGASVFGIAVIAYCLAYNGIQFLFVVLGFREIRLCLRGKAYEDLDVVLDSPFTPPLSVIVPAYNEEKTIVDSLESILRIRFPRAEIIIVNDGSGDGTLRRIIDEFGFERVEITYEERITTSPVRGFYEKRTSLPSGVTRWVLVDKENGGKADALNAGINASTCPFFVSMDADSLIDPDALLQAFRVMLADDGVAVIGGQVALANGCEIRGGRVERIGLPGSSLARFQVVEYVRSFSLGRTALGVLDSILIVSGVFGIFRKETVLGVGGYLTRFLTGKIAREYAGEGRTTVCEDMEIIVRIQRYIREKRLRQRVAFTPYPLCWTEAPEDARSLGKQRNRWTRGLAETLSYHRTLLFSRRHGRIGMFAYPYFLLFEFLGAPIEIAGYLLLPVFYLLGILSVSYLVIFFLVSAGFGTVVSVAAVASAAWPERRGEGPKGPPGSLLRYRGGDVAILLLYGFLENFGYRQMTLWWRVRGLWDFLFTEKGWEKFERKGFGEPMTPAAPRSSNRCGTP